jgi:hypothetical protein
MRSADPRSAAPARGRRLYFKPRTPIAGPGPARLTSGPRYKFQLTVDVQAETIR